MPLISSRSCLTRAADVTVGAMIEGLESRRLFAAGDLDPSFGSGGVASTAIGASSEAFASVVQSNGKLVVAGVAPSASGATTDAILMRYNADGTPDTRFGNGGVARVDFGGNEAFFDLALLPGGQLLAGGRQLDGKYMLVRFTVDGVVDVNSGFGSGGIAVGDGSVAKLAVGPGNSSLYTIGGLASAPVLRGHSPTSGALLSTFGNGGIVNVETAAPMDGVGLSDLALQPDGRIVTVGSADGDPDAGGDDGASNVFGIARFNPNGSVDQSFGIGGAVLAGFDAESSVPTGIAVRQSDGLIAVVGTDGGPDADLLALNPDGTVAQRPDGLGRFGGFGPVALGEAPDPSDVVFDPRGRVIIVGQAETDDALEMWVTRYTAQGELDTTFGGGDGFSIVSVPGSSRAFSRSVALGPNGNILIAGMAVPDDDASTVTRVIAAARVINNDAPILPGPSTPTIAIIGGVLVGSGTGGNDVFTVRRTGGDDVIVSINGSSGQFDMDDFTGIRLEGLAGMDLFRLVDPVVTSTLNRNVTVLGGNGQDAVDYGTRTTAMSFTGLEAPDSATPFPYVAAASGQRVDRVALDVEQIRGTQAGDTFDINDAGNIGQNISMILSGGLGNDTFTAGAGPQHTLAGGAGNDIFRIEGGTPFVEGGAGNDAIRLIADADFAHVDGGTGVDAIDVSASTVSDVDIEDRPIENVIGIGRLVAMNVIGNSRDNLITTAGGFAGAGGAFAVRVFADGGNDTVVGGSAADEMVGAEGNDSLVGNAGNDTMDGGTGTDTLEGGAGTNQLSNGEVVSGAPTVSITLANRRVTAVASEVGDFVTVRRTGTDDIIVTVNSTSRQFDIDDFDGVLIQTLGGYDEIRIIDPVAAGTVARKVTVEGGAGNDTLRGSNGAEVFRGGAGDDQGDGVGGADALFGDAGNDLLAGGTGSDFLDGGDGNDNLIANDDNEVDTVLGGNGTDTAFLSPTDQRSGVEQVF